MPPDPERQTLTTGWGGNLYLRIKSVVSNIILSRTFITSSLIAGFLLGTLVVLQRKILYQPEKKFEDEYPKNLIKDLFLTTKDGVKIHAWFVAQQPTFPTILFFHGNAGNISHRWGNIRYLLSHRVPANIMLVSYRGYGKSEGRPTESGMIADAEAALDHLKNQKTKEFAEKVIVFGRSLGGAVALALIERRREQIAGVILENTFTSIGDMAGSLIPLPFPWRLFVLDNWDNLQRIKHTASMPVLFFSGRRDEIVPSKQMDRLYERRMEQGGTELNTMFVKINSGTHNDTWVREVSLYFSKFSDFVFNISKL